jgi:hypothetical protein
MPLAGRIVQLSHGSSIGRRNASHAAAATDCHAVVAIGALREPSTVERVSRVPQLETIMINLKVLSSAAAIALLLPLVAPTESFAQNPNGSKANGTHGGAGVHAGGGGMRPGGGGMRAGGGGGVHAGGGGGGYHGGYHGGGGGGAFIPGAIAGAVIGGAIAAQGYGPGYYAPPADYYYDDSAAAGPPPGDNDAVGYCMQTYRSYDPQSGTYLGNDGQRHPCP